MKLAFTGQPAMAAAVILAGTSLRHLVSESGPIRWTFVTGINNSCTLEIDDEWRWSSGEKWLNELLFQLSETATPFMLHGVIFHIDDRCDAETARVCREAVALLDAA